MSSNLSTVGSAEPEAQGHAPSRQLRGVACVLCDSWQAHSDGGAHSEGGLAAALDDLLGVAAQESQSLDWDGEHLLRQQQRNDLRLVQLSALLGSTLKPRCVCPAGIQDRASAATRDAGQEREPEVGDSSEEEEASESAVGEAASVPAQLGVENGGGDSFNAEEEMEFEPSPAAAQGKPLQGKGVCSGRASDPLPAEVKVLFVGENVDDELKDGFSHIKLDTERKAMRSAFLSGADEHERAVKVKFLSAVCLSAAEVATAISKCKPMIVHFACHGEVNGLWFAAGFVDGERLMDVILSNNQLVEPKGDRIRLVVFNACNSAELAEQFAGGGGVNGGRFEGISFVIGHGIPVGEEHAQGFCRAFYENLGGGQSLQTSFRNSGLASVGKGGYTLFAETVDPAHFKIELPVLAGGQPGPGLTLAEPTELAMFLRDHISDADRLCEEIGVRTKKGLMGVNAEDLDALEWMKKPQRKYVLELIEQLKEVKEVLAPHMVRSDNDGGESNASGDDTDYASEEENDEEQRPEVVACYNKGPPGDFRELMSRLLRDFVSSGRGQGGGGLTFCSLLLLCFMHTEFGLFAKKKAKFLGAESRDALLAFERGSGDEASVLRCFAVCMERARTEASLKGWGYGDSRQRYGKAADLQVVVIDCVVKKMLPVALLGAWNCEVWYQGIEPTQAFVDRANTFLATHVTSLDGSFKALGDPGEQTVGIPGSGSVAFLRASSLTALLFFEHLRVRKLRHEAAGAGVPLSLEGFGLFVGSTRAPFGVEGGDLPSKEPLRIIVRGLGAIAAEDLAALESPLPPAVFAFEGPFIRQYLEASVRVTESIPDSGTGQVLMVRGQCVTLRVVEGTAVQNFEDENEKTEWYCPLSLLAGEKVLMQDPVTCSDGITYERAVIERRMQLPDPAGKTGMPLDRSRVNDNNVMKRDIEEFKARGLAEHERVAAAAEGAEEQQLYLRRMNYSGAMPGADRGGSDLSGPQNDLSVLGMVSRGSKTRAVCITGPPAAGKTISMLRIATEAALAALLTSDVSDADESSAARAARAASLAIHSMLMVLPNADSPHSVDNLRIPLFLRASELSRYIDDMGGGDVDLVELFVKKKWPDYAEVLLKLYDLGHLLPIVDGLDEGAVHRKRIEDFVSEALERHPGMSLIVSTREKHFDESRRGKRLEAFKPAQVQPLDEQGQDDLISYRVKEEQRGEFKVQLAVVTAGAPELKESPFLLTLLTNLFNQEGSLPRDRTELYERQVRSALKLFFSSREAATVAKLGLNYEDLAAVQDRSFEFLRTLAFVCHSVTKAREFDFNSTDASKKFQGALADRWGEVQTEFLEHSRGSEEVTGKAFETSEMEKWLMPQEGSCVSILVCTSEHERKYRFGHLTVQEYLAASFVARFKDPADIWAALHDKRQAISGQWNREVLLFSVGMMDEDMFFGFAALLLGKEDGRALCACQGTGAAVGAPSVHALQQLFERLSNPSNLESFEFARVQVSGDSDSGGGRAGSVPSFARASAHGAFGTQLVPRQQRNGASRRGTCEDFARWEARCERSRGVSALRGTLVARTAGARRRIARSREAVGHHPDAGPIFWEAAAGRCVGRAGYKLATQVRARTAREVLSETVSGDSINYLPERRAG
ncbi:hypothetical protein T484DRAFT_2198337 [Baffinella frigidus]|nr:hypothetical protein T484DRAFT_2198337 [Cryptophyta sp. CCMP2293]